LPLRKKGKHLRYADHSAARKRGKQKKRKYLYF